MSVHDGHRERKRQRYKEEGLGTFQEHEVLELLLYYSIAQKDTNEIAHELLRTFGSFSQVFLADVEQLAAVKGMTRNAAILIKLVPQLMHRAHLTSLRNDAPLDTVERIGDFFTDLFVCENNEVMYQLCLDAKGRKLSCQKVAEGDPSSVSLNLRRIVQNALKCNAVMVAIAHNHPSGVAFPSHGDKIATQQIADALRAVNVPLIDHIVVAGNDYISFRDDGLL